LISAREVFVPRKRPRLIPPDEFPSEVQELEHEIFHARAKLLDGVPKEIVKDCGRDGCRQPHGCGNQGFGDSRSNRAQAGRTGGGELLERIDDAPHGPEQADERRHRSGGGQETHVALQASNLFAHAQLQTAFERYWIRDSAARFHLPRNFAIAEIKNSDQRRPAELFTDHRHGLESRRFAKGPQKGAIGGLGATKHGPFGKNDRPGKYREDQEQHHDSLGQGAGALNEIPKLQLQEQPAKLGKYQPGSFRFNDSVPPVRNDLKNRTGALCFTV